MSLSHQAVLNQEVQALLDKKAVHQVQNNDSTGFTSSLFVVPKKDGGNRPVVNLKLLNQFLVYKHFKMEGIHMLRDLLREGDYLVKIYRPQRCLLDSSNLERSPEVLALSMERYNARVCMPSLWTGHSSQGLHKIDETCGGHVETEGGAPNYLFRRHFDNGGVRRSSAPPSCFDPESPRKSGVCNQLQEIPTCPKPTDRIFRFSYRFRNYVGPIIRREVTKDQEAVSAIT